MGRVLRVILAGALLAGGSATLVLLLAGQGLDRAEKWVSIGGVILSVVLAGAGLAVAWLAWRRPVTPAPEPAGDTGTGPQGVDARGARGVQIGDGNTQHNTF